MYEEARISYTITAWVFLQKFFYSSVDSADLLWWWIRNTQCSRRSSPTALLPELQVEHDKESKSRITRRDMPKLFSFALVICIVSLPLPESYFVQVSKSFQAVWKGGHYAECLAGYLAGMICRSSEHTQLKPEGSAFWILKHYGVLTPQWNCS